MTTKICSKCKRELSIEMFCKDKSRKDGLYCYCKDCKKENGKKYNENNRERRLKYGKEYYKNNKEKKSEYGKKHYKENKEKRAEYYKERSKNNKDKINAYSKKYRNSNALYLTYVNRLTVEEDPISDENGYLLVRCTHCKKYFYPTNSKVKSRWESLTGITSGENRLYCSDACKHSCPLYGFDPHHQFQPGSKEWEEKQNKGPNRDPVLQADWRKMVLERDDYKCVKCGATENLTAHHVEGIHWNPLESVDIDIGITLCESCNRKAHSLEGCSYYDMRCK